MNHVADAPCTDRFGACIRARDKNFCQTIPNIFFGIADLFCFCRILPAYKTSFPCIGYGKLV